MPDVTLLGPQRFLPTLGRAVRAAGVEGMLASVTAGWQEREAEDLELHEHLEERTVNLMLYARSEEVFARDPDLFRAHRERQERLRALQELYRLRLAHLKRAARELIGRSGDPALLEPEREAAIAALRELDAHHLARMRRINDEFDAAWRPLERPAVARQVEQIASALAGVEALAVAGGHVAILLNRLRLFGLDRLLGTRRVFAWSAGAMAVCERVVLFHDSPPQGQGNAEVLEAGLGWAVGVVALPHARRRLRLDDRARVALFARRFEPALCLVLDDGGELALGDAGYRADAGVRRLTTDGGVEPLGAA